MRYKVVEQQSMCQEMLLCISLQCCYKYGHMLNNEINVLTADHVSQSSSFRVFLLLLFLHDVSDSRYPYGCGSGCKHSSPAHLLFKPAVYKG